MAFDRNAEADQAYGHKPVLLDECLEALAIRPDGVYLDGTLGRAGHSLEILRRLTAGGRLIGLDRDGTALEAARVRLAEYADRVTLVHSNFSRLAEVLDDLHIDAVDGMLFDLGVSSPQLDDAERGFSYMHDAPLDMRMDRTAGLTARDVVNGWSYEELRRILFEYARNAMPPPSPGTSWSAGKRLPSRLRGSWWRRSAPPCLRRRCGRSSTPPSGAFRPSASLSTASWRSCRPCCMQRRSGCIPADGWR